MDSAQLETQVKNSHGDFTVFVDPNPFAYDDPDPTYTVQVINRTKIAAMSEPDYSGDLVAGCSTDGMYKNDALNLYKRVRSADNPEAYLRAAIRQGR